jgi:hypothetical protein
MARAIKLGINRPATHPLLPDPEPRPVKYTTTRDPTRSA